MTTIEGNINGVDVEPERPEPVEQDGVWYEDIDLRPPKEDDNYISYTGKVVTALFNDYGKLPHRIMRPIPRPTPEQLAAIGMRERDQGPVECEPGDVIWGLNLRSDTGHTCVSSLMSPLNNGKHRWVLVPADNPPVAVPVEKEVEHYSCEGCGNNRINSCPACYEPGDSDKRKNWLPKPLVAQAGTVHTDCVGCKRYVQTIGINPICATCFDPDRQERKNYTPAPAPAPTFNAQNPVVSQSVCYNKLCTDCCSKDCSTGFVQKQHRPAPAPKVTDAQTDKFSEVVQECFKLGMGTNGIEIDPEDVIAFIRSLAQRAGEGFTVEEILKAVDDEPELPGDDPYAMQHILMCRDRLTIAEVLRAVVRATKRGIRERIKAVTKRNDTRPDRGMGE